MAAAATKTFFARLIPMPKALWMKVWTYPLIMVLAKNDIEFFWFSKRNGGGGIFENSLQVSVWVWDLNFMIMASKYKCWLCWCNSKVEGCSLLKDTLSDYLLKIGSLSRTSVDISRTFNWEPLNSNSNVSNTEKTRTSIGTRCLSLVSIGL